MKTQISNKAVGAQAQVNNLSDAMFLADIACQAEEDAIADAFYMAELAAEAELDAILIWCLFLRMLSLRFLMVTETSHLCSIL